MELGSNRSCEMVRGFTSEEVTRAAEGRIRSEPGNRTLPLIISATMQPTDHTSTAAQGGDDTGGEGAVACKMQMMMAKEERIHKTQNKTRHKRKGWRGNDGQCTPCKTNVNESKKISRR